MNLNSIKTKSFSIALLLFLLTAIPTIIFVIKYSKDASENLAKENASIQSKYTMQKLLTILDKEIALANKMADSQILREWANDENNTILKQKALNELESFKKIFKDHSYFFAIKSSGNYYFNDKDGTYTGNEKRYVLDPYKIEDRWFYKTLQSNQMIQINTDYDNKLGVTKVWINKVFVDNNNKLGILGTGIDLTAFINDIFSNNTNNIVNFFIDNRGFIQAHKNLKLIDYGALNKVNNKHGGIYEFVKSKDEIDLLQKNLDIVMNNKNQTITMKLHILDSEKIVAISYIDELRWFSVSMVDNDLIDLTDLFGKYLIFSLSGFILFIFALMYLLNKNVLQPIMKLNDSLLQIEDGKYNIDLTLDTQDEIGNLALNIKQMAKKVENYTNDLENEVKVVTKEIEKQQAIILEQSKMAALGDMIGNIAHQWRQPLSVITANASIISLQHSLGQLETDQIPEKMEDIIHQSNYLSQTIDTFRNFIEGGNEKEEAVICEAIDEAILIVKDSFKYDNITIHDQIHCEEICGAKILLSKNEFEQVIINLFNNSKDAIIENKIEEGWIKITHDFRDNVAIIMIEDNGGGIPENVLPHIFEPYFTTKHQSQGTGLGLHMSYKIITASMNGKIYASNTENGALFTIEIPMINNTSV